MSMCRCEKKDIRRVACWLDAHMLGVFVKSVLRVVSYLDVVRNWRVLLLGRVPELSGHPPRFSVEYGEASLERSP